MPGSRNKRAFPSFPRIANLYRTGGIDWSFIQRSRARLTWLISKSHRHAGIQLNLMCERIRRRGSGCTSTGATCPQDPTGLIRFMQISIGRLKICCKRRKRSNQKQKTATLINCDGSYQLQGGFCETPPYLGRSVTPVRDCSLIEASLRIKRASRHGSFICIRH